jgi:4-amino-4-deoxy-L-arabinose transferase-like glycosyltransferase
LTPNNEIPNREYDGARWSRQPKWLALILAFFLISLLGTAFVSRQVFEGIPHLEDEIAFQFQAQTLAGGRLWAPIPDHPEFFSRPFLIEHEGKWFGKYPPGHPAILALGELVGQPWLVNPLASSLTLVFLFLIGRKIYGARTGALACLLALVSPFFLLQSGTFLSHPTTVLLMTVFIYCFLRSLEPRSRHFALLAGFALGAAFLCRQLTAVALVMPFVIYGLTRLPRNPGTELKRNGLIVLGFLPFLVMLLAYNNVLTGNPIASPYELYWPYDKIGFGPGAGPSNGHTLVLGRLNTELNLTDLSTTLFGWPWRLDLAPLGIAALAIVTRLAMNLWHWLAQKPDQEANKPNANPHQAETWDILLLASFVSIVLFHVLYWASGRMYGPRYYFEAMPALLLLSARGIIQLQDVIARAFAAIAKFLASPVPRQFKRWSALLVTATIAALIVHSLTLYLPEQLRAYQGWYGITGEDVRLASRMDLEKTLVFIPRGDSWTDRAPLLMLNEPTLDSSTIFAVDFGPTKNELLLSHYPDYRVLYWQDLTPSTTP